IFRTPKSIRVYSVFLLNNAIIDLASAVASLLGTVRVVVDLESALASVVFLGPCTHISANFCRICHDAFAYRLFILSNIKDDHHPTRSQIWLLCLVTYILLGLPGMSYYFVQEDPSPEDRKRFGLEGYVIATVHLFGKQVLAVMINAIVLSPIVMTSIFVVRRKLLDTIALEVSDLLKAKIKIQALTYQMLLPCGGAIGATLFLLDLTQIWGNEMTQRLIMLVINIFSLASPIINFTTLPPYRALLPCKKNTVSPSGSKPIDFTTI
ncbi:hypothetical protein PMAYCL1PPCAC_08572, partial [Pristionchus mayeri]